MDLTSRLKAWREHKGLSQRKLAKLLDVTPQCVCMWESGNNLPSHRNLTKFVELMGITMPRLYGPLPKPKKVAA